MKTRNGKIARLPITVREGINQRLEEGMPAGEILPWLNALPEVKQVLTDQFGGQAVSAQNLSEWRKGGYRDWLARREDKEILRRLREDAEAFGDGSPLMASDVVSANLMARFARVMAATQNIQNWAKPANWKQLCELSELITAIRKADHSAERLRLEREQLEATKKRLHLLEEQTRKRTFDEWRDWMQNMMNIILDAYPDNDQRLEAVGRLLHGETWSGNANQTQSN